MITGKHLKSDCTKRNIVYKIQCLTCAYREIEKIEKLFEDEDESEKKQKISEVQAPTYIGESSRSAFERGLEHLNQLATLNRKSHEGEDFSDVKWGMFIVAHKKSAFERQIEQAVMIERISKNTEILNSKSEWNSSALPRLVTRMGTQEEDLKKTRKRTIGREES